MDARRSIFHNRRVSYHPYRGFESDKHRRYIALWSLNWDLLDRRELGAASDLFAEMQRAIADAAAEGWQCESDPDFGFAFLRRDDTRRLMMLTPRDPLNQRLQSFNPFR